MTKLKNPLLSFGATGPLGKLFSLAKRQGRHIIERRPIPVDAKSPAQLFNRHMFTKCTALWHLLDETEKQEWERLATLRHMTGYAWFISQCLRPNPGIYLPLQGGTMSGRIFMGKNRLMDLPSPFYSQEAVNKAYADTFSKVIWKDLSQQVLSDYNRTVTHNFIDLDLTASTSPNAKFAICRMRLRADTVGTGAYSFIAARKNGTAAVHYPFVRLDKAGTTIGVYNHDTFTLGIDDGQVIEYKIWVGTGWQIDSKIEILGYIE